MIEEIVALLHPGEAEQYSSRRVLKSIAPNYDGLTPLILDLGCGDGKSFEWFRSELSSFVWKGLDIESSPEVNSRKRQDLSFHTYNGVNIPFDDSYFDIVLSHQVFEHIRYPEVVLREICRVLRPGGVFFGSVSYLEPYHSFSLFNYTPLGWSSIVRDCGLNLVTLAGGIDSISLIKRNISRASAEPSWWHCSPLNRETIENANLSPIQKKYRILMNAGHIVFLARKP